MVIITCCNTNINITTVCPPKNNHMIFIILTDITPESLQNTSALRNLTHADVTQVFGETPNSFDQDIFDDITGKRE